jgi:hypothetical protein
MLSGFAAETTETKSSNWLTIVRMPMVSEASPPGAAPISSFRDTAPIVDRRPEG